MKKHIKIMIAMLTLCLLAFVAGACSATGGNSGEKFTGELIDTQGDRVVVRGESETMLFYTGDSTEYDLGSEEELGLGDAIEITYHKANRVYVADAIKLLDKKIEATILGGEVTELSDDYLTVQAESLTVVFTHDENTSVQGDLNRGDSVIVTYEGNLSEQPYASSIVVVSEGRAEEEKNLHGTVSEVATDSFIASVDSAHASRFKLTKDTKISGDDTTLKVGDEVDVVYTGTAGEDAVAVSVKIKRNEKQKFFVMDGIIDSVSKDKIKLRTAKNTYTFKIVKDTQIENKENMKAEQKATITYVGELNDNPTATSIFCSKDAAKKNEKKKEDPKPAPEPQPEPQPEPGPEPQPVVNTFKVVFTDGQGNTLSEQDVEEGQAATAPEDPTREGYTFTGWDQDFSNITADLTVNALWEETPAPEPEPQPELEPAPEPEPQPEPEPEPEPAPASEPKEVIIKAKGEIEKWDDKCSIKLDGGSKVELNTKDAKIAAGYIPLPEDRVIIKYDKESMKLVEIQLEHRPADDTPAEGGDA